MGGFVKVATLIVFISFFSSVNAIAGNNKVEVQLEKDGYQAGILKASVLDDFVYLFWTTQGDFESFSMVVEHSIDGLSWNEILTDVKDMHASEGHKFQFVDKRRSLGRNYYRVKVKLGSDVLYSTIGDVFLNKCDGPLSVRKCSKQSLTFSLDESAGTTKEVSLYDESGHSLGCTLQENKGVYIVRIEQGKELVGDYTLKICTEKGLYTSHIHVN